MTNKKSAIPNASEMRNLVRKETKKVKPNYKKLTSKLMDAIKVDPKDKNETSSQNMMKTFRADRTKNKSKKTKAPSNYVRSRGGDSKAVTEAKAAMEGRTKAPKRTPESSKKSTYVMDRGGDSKAVTDAKAAMEGRTKAPAKNQKYVGAPLDVYGDVKKPKAVKPKKKSLKSSLKVEDPSMDPSAYEAKNGTVTDKPIINDTPELADQQKIQETRVGAERMKRAEQHSPNLWAGLAPLAMGAIMGDIGVGATVGGGMMMEQALHNRDFQDKRELASLKAKNDGQPKRGMYQWKNYQKADGTIGQMKVNTATGEEFDTNRVAGFKRSITKDPTTGELASISGSTLDDNYKRVNPSKGLNVAQQGYQAKFRETLLKDKQFQSYRKSNASSGQALTMLAANNPIGDKAIMTIMPRIMGEVGNLTAAEQNAYSGSPLFSRKLEALQERLLETGGFTEADRADLMEVAQVMQTHSQAKATELLNMYKESEQNIRGYDPSKAVDTFNTKSDVTPKDIIKRVKKRAPTAGKHKKMSSPNPVRDGYIDIFELNPMGEYKYLKTIKE